MLIASLTTNPRLYVSSDYGVTFSEVAAPAGGADKD